MKVAVYCRVSTDKEDQTNSFESQKSYFERSGIWHRSGSAETTSIRAVPWVIPTAMYFPDGSNAECAVPVSSESRRN